MCEELEESNKRGSTKQVFQTVKTLPKKFHLVTLCCRLFEPKRLSSPAFSTVSFLSSHLLVPPASFQLFHVSHPSIFSLVVLFSSFHLRMPASFFFLVHLIA